eukprot:c19354_g1_i1.p1 GENE.c19354_g1_i1~~c19354_g1_i1.p1  ORF type:complete len:242 (-),score=78.97 c19354_g1_i1:19-744(-)
MKTILFFDEKKEFGELSNFWKMSHPLIFEGEEYKTSEHLYQAMRYIIAEQTPEIVEYIREIRTAKTPYMSKILANQDVSDKRYEWRRKLIEIIDKYYDHVSIAPQWFDVNIDAMRHILRLKFTTDQKCKDLLINTGSNLLAENSPYDDFWGLGRDGDGENWLGKILVEIREELKNSKEKTKVTQNDAIRLLDEWVREQRVKSVSSNSSSNNEESEEEPPKKKVKKENLIVIDDEHEDEDNK